MLQIIKNGIFPLMRKYPVLLVAGSRLQTPVLQIGICSAIELVYEEMGCVTMIYRRIEPLIHII